MPSISLHKVAEKLDIPNLRTYHFEESEDIMTKFKSQALHITRIINWKARGSGNPPFLIPALRKIAIYRLHAKNQILCTILHMTVTNVKDHA